MVLICGETAVSSGDVSNTGGLRDGSAIGRGSQFSASHRVRSMCSSCVVR